MSNATLKSIAKASGFSVTTVSRALAGYSDVKEKTREHIIQIANELGYQPNLVARQLRSQRTHTIGMVIPANVQGSEDDFFSTLIRGVSRAAAEHHYDILISAQLPNANEMDAYRRIVGGNRIDGIILARTHQNDERIEYLKQREHPFVVSGRLAPDQASDFPYIDLDSQTGLQMMVEHLIDYGHQHIGLILPPPDIAYTPYRLTGYRHGLAAARLPYRAEYISHGDLERDSGYRAAGELLRQQPQLTAIIACNDLMAMGAMAAVQERGLVVGPDIAVGGFDDIPSAQHTIPPLTTIRQPIFEIGQRLIEMLIKIIDGNPPIESQILLQPVLVIRDSSGPKRYGNGR
jgi:LacI family transcriptional regulator